MRGGEYMLNNLKAEFVRCNIEPYVGVMNALCCSEKTARNKLNGVSPVTVPEAAKIINKYFPKHSVEYLFIEDLNTSAHK